MYFSIFVEIIFENIEMLNSRQRYDNKQNKQNKQKVKCQHH